MKSINRQLNIGVTPMNTNIVPSRYARSANNYQVQLGTEDPSLDFYNDSQALESMSNANGWQSDSESIDYDERLDYMEEYYNAFGGFLGLGYPACINVSLNVKIHKVLNGVKAVKDAIRVAVQSCKQSKMLI